MASCLALLRAQRHSQRIVQRTEDTRATVQDTRVDHRGDRVVTGPTGIEPASDATVAGLLVSNPGNVDGFPRRNAVVELGGVTDQEGCIRNLSFRHSKDIKQRRVGPTGVADAFRPAGP